MTPAHAAPKPPRSLRRWRQAITVVALLATALMLGIAWGVR